MNIEYQDRQAVPFVTDSNGHEVYAGETAYFWDGRTLCVDCFRDELDEILWHDTDLMAEMIGAESFDVEWNAGGHSV